MLFIDSTTAAQQAGLEFAAVRQTVRRAWSAYLTASGEAERPGESGTVSAIDLLDDDVDLTPSRHLQAAASGITHDPRRLLDAAEEIRAALGTLGASLPSLRIASQHDTVPAWVPLEDLVRSGAAEILRPGPHAVPGPGQSETGHFEPAVTSQDIVRGKPPSGTLPLDPASGDTARIQADDVLVPATAAKTVARVATVEQVGAVLGRGVYAVRVDPQILDPWFLAGAISGADGTPGSGYVTATLSGVPRTDFRRLHIPVLPIETQRFYGKAYRRLAEFETLVTQAAERSSDIARELASGLVSQALEPEPGQEQV